MATIKTLEIPVAGMDCAECARQVKRAITELEGVHSVEVLLAAEKATIRLDPERVDMSAIRKVVERAGYKVSPAAAAPSLGALSKSIFALLGTVFAAVLFVVVAGEWLGLFENLTERVPFLVGVALVVAAGWPIYRNVIRSTLRRQITAHTLMSVGSLAALAVGEWVAALVVVFFMHVGKYVEDFTAKGARRAVKNLAAMAPQTARIERNGIEQDVPVGKVQLGDTVIVRPGERIPVDGEVIWGQATVDQAAITGESMPVEVATGSRVYAATIARLGSLRVRTVRVGLDTTFGRVVTMVEEAEAHKGEMQRFADRFSSYYLPIVVGIAALTFALSRDPLAAAAVLVVACSCAIAIATPVAMLASIGQGARRGLLIKGGKYLELLPRADVLLIDKTGTITFGKPRLTDVVPLNGLADELLMLAASAERYSEHPLAEAVRAAAREQGLTLAEPERFEAVPGQGIRAWVNGRYLEIGNRRLVPAASALPVAAVLEAQGKTVLFCSQDGELAGVLAVADTPRPEVPAALTEVKRLGIGQIELLTGDNERTAAALAGQLGIRYRADLLPEDKIAVVKDYQARGHTVVMVGDGVNDAPALAQADVGIAMGAAGSDVAIEAAHIVLMREDWALVPEVFRTARRTMGVAKLNLGFTALFNLGGLALASLGLLPVALAAAAQSLPDIGILINSARLLRKQ